MTKLYVNPKAEPNFREESIRSEIFAKVKAAGKRGLDADALKEKLDGATGAIRYLVLRKYVHQKAN